MSLLNNPTTLSLVIGLVIAVIITIYYLIKNRNNKVTYTSDQTIIIEDLKLLRSYLFSLFLWGFLLFLAYQLLGWLLLFSFRLPGIFLVAALNAILAFIVGYEAIKAGPYDRLSPNMRKILSALGGIPGGIAWILAIITTYLSKGNFVGLGSSLTLVASILGGSIAYKKLESRKLNQEISNEVQEKDILFKKVNPLLSILILLPFLLIVAIIIVVLGFILYIKLLTH